jgi:xanthine dehydrogenase accessory factor
MKDLLDDLKRLYQDGESFALAVVSSTWNSAPRPVGAAMAVDTAGHVYGSVSGGCVEGAVYEEALAVLANGASKKLTFGVSDGDAFSVGLTCGGTIELILLSVTRQTWPDFEHFVSSLESDTPTSLIFSADKEGHTPIALINDRLSGSTGQPRLDEALVDDARGFLVAGQSGILRYGPHGERRGDERSFLILSFLPRPKMYVFGAIDFARAVATTGVFLGFHTTVCDARATFATSARFPDVDEVVVQWPHQFLQNADVDDRTVICVLTHDPKFDVPLLIEALKGPSAYIGVMGSRRTHERRLGELREAGVSESDLNRLHSPIGLDLGARTPEETAISIAAEIIKERWKGSGLPLKDSSGPIHR